MLPSGSNSTLGTLQHFIARLAKVSIHCVLVFLLFLFFLRVRSTAAGRTGTVICAYLSHRYMDKGVTSQTALDFFAERRTHNKKGRVFFWSFGFLVSSMLLFFVFCFVFLFLKVFCCL